MDLNRIRTTVAAMSAMLTIGVTHAATSDGTVKGHRKISALQGGFTGTLDISDNLGTAVAALGDLDGDGVGDVAVGAPGDDDGGGNRGAVWILFLRSDGRVKSLQKISSIEGGFTGDLFGPGDAFGSSVANIGDLDGDNNVDLAVGAPSDSSDGDGGGSVWILFLNADGTVKGHQKISDTAGSFAGALDGLDDFGHSVAGLGDLDGTGSAVSAIAVGALRDDDGGSGRGAVWILFLKADGTVSSHQKISDTAGGFTGGLENGDGFGSGLAALGDFDGSGVTELAVGALDDDDGPGGCCPGAVYVLFLNADGTVSSHQKISNLAGGLGGVLETGDNFGHAVANLGDLDGDGLDELAVGTPGDNDGGVFSSSPGSLWILFLHSDGTVRARQKVSQTVGGFTGTLGLDNAFGSALAALGDLDGDGLTELASGAPSDDDGTTHAGAVWVLFLDLSASDLAIGLGGAEGPGGAAGSGFAWVPDPPNGFGSLAFVQVPWGDYSTTNGETRPAWCDVDGDGRHELVLGLGSAGGGVTGGAGFIEVREDDEAGFAHLKWLQLPWGNYQAANGETWPACGDVDDDGRDEIVVGLGQGGGGFFYVYDDADADYAPHPSTPNAFGWVQLGWGDYNLNIGEVRPAVGNLDDDHAEEIVLGLAPGGNGFAQMRDDAANGFVPLTGAPVAGGWVGIPWGTYNVNNGESWPAICDLNGDGVGEVVLGLGNDDVTGTGGSGFGRIFDAADGFASPSPGTGIGDGGWFQVSWGDYNLQVGGVHPACGLDEDVAEELLLGLASFPPNGGFTEIRDDLSNGLAHLQWVQVPFGDYNVSDGLTRPAAAR